MPENTVTGLPQFFTAPIISNNQGITIRLPKEAAELLAAKRNSVFCTFVDGVLQISGSQPNIAIPVLTIESARFIRQPR